MLKAKFHPFVISPRISPKHILSKLYSFVCVELKYMEDEIFSSFS